MIELLGGVTAMRRGTASSLVTAVSKCTRGRIGGVWVRPVGYKKVRGCRVVLIVGFKTYRHRETERHPASAHLSQLPYVELQE